LTLLNACSSGSGGTDVTIGSGQNGDPVTEDFPVFYVKRPVPDPEELSDAQADARRLLRFDVGADLYMRDRASPSSPEINITAAETAGLGDIRDLDVDFAGKKVLFSMRAKFIEDADDEDQPTWNIWEYDTTTHTLRRVIPSLTIDEEGQDIMPHYLPDGRIVFTSTRQQQSRAILLDENKPQYAAQDEDRREPAFVLHVMDADGSNIRQISFNQSHDLDPSVLNNGQIVFTRWEHNSDDNQFDLYRVNPDGTGLELLYGANSHNTGTVNPTTGQPSIIQFMRPRAMQDGRTLALVRPFQGTDEGGDLMLIDTETYVDNTRPTAANAGMTGPAQVRALPTDVRTTPGVSPGGRYRSAAPLFDSSNRLLVSWSQCRLLEGTRIVPCTSDRLNDTVNLPVAAPPLYGVYIYNVQDNTQQPIVTPQEGFIYTEVVAGSGRSRPPAVVDLVAGVDFPQALLTESVGILNIRSVYDIDGVDTAPGGIATVRNPASPAYATRPARFLRIEKAVSQPDDDVRDVPNTAFGPNRTLGMRDILGYAPIEPDGSVKVKVPANVALAITVLDANGRRLGGAIGSRHTNWLQVVPGEVLACNGCHNPSLNPTIAHGRRGLTASVNAGATATGTAFANTNAEFSLVNAGETMAEVRGRAMCGGTCKPSVQLVFDDYWPSAGITPEASYDACYHAGTTTDVASSPTADIATGEAPLHMCAADGGIKAANYVAPTSAQCEQTWSNRCRVTIHYEKNIHPLWAADRRVVDAGMVQIADHTCTSCHNTVDAANAAQVPAGQLDLTDGPSDDEATQFRAYRELLFADTELELQGASLVERQVQVGVDPVTGLPQFAPVAVSASMTSAGARLSRFFTKFDVANGTVDHRGFLTRAELKLLAEWVDIGAQYYNDPFVAPEN
jgi:hypothetical protein